MKQDCEKKLSESFQEIEIEILKYIKKNNETLSILLLATGLSLYQINNKYIIFLVMIGIVLISVHFLSRYFPPSVKELQIKKKEGKMSILEKCLYHKIYSEYWGAIPFIKNNFPLLYSWIFFFGIFIYKVS